MSSRYCPSGMILMWQRYSSRMMSSINLSAWISPFALELLMYLRCIVTVSGDRKMKIFDQRNFTRGSAKNLLRKLVLFSWNTWTSVFRSLQHFLGSNRLDLHGSIKVVILSTCSYCSISSGAFRVCFMKVLTSFTRILLLQCWNVDLAEYSSSKICLIYALKARRIGLYRPLSLTVTPRRTTGIAL